MMAVLLLVILAGSMFLAAPRPSHQTEARDTAMRMRAMLTAALADAEADGGEVIVRADALADSTRNGRFLALAGAPGVTTEDDPAADWVELEQGVAWRAGTATVDPMGAPTDGRVPGTVRCTASACQTGDADYVVYRVGHLQAAGVSWALVLTRERGVQLFRWDEPAAAWEAAR
jgi:hypothetical protein